jgi:hypothetical protein
VVAWSVFIAGDWLDRGSVARWLDGSVTWSDMARPASHGRRGLAVFAARALCVDDMKLSARAEHAPESS